MAWFLQFHQRIPDEAPPSTLGRYDIGDRIRIDSVKEQDHDACPSKDLQLAILAFERKNDIADWRQIADGFRTFRSKES
ncbi:MAG: hypothetical protein AAF191_20535 [Verrucomicrobiota bacterium]